MPRAFHITPSLPAATLRPDGTASVSFLVSNNLRRPVQVKLSVVPSGQTAASWLSVAAPVLVDLPSDGTHKVVVLIAVPPDAPAGAYAFSLRAAAERTPDDDYAESQEVSFERRATPPPFRWWIPVAAGVLALVLSGAGYATYRSLRPCSPENCVEGCCASGVCVVPPKPEACGAKGAACTVCNADVTDTCRESECLCGEGPPCTDGLRCMGGQCTCDAKTCTDGCCNGNRCSKAAESCETSARGACKAGRSACSDGGWECVPGAPTAEACDGIDNNCNGTVDDVAAGGPCTADATGQCRQGQQQCRGGAWACIPGAPASETCDGVDNNCNGSIDDVAPGGPCTANAPGQCRQGQQQCRSGAWACIAGPASAETCDNVDNNCNGAVDDLPAGGGCTASAAGQCRQGQLVCRSGAWVCTPGAASGEVCDGIDNNCDGAVDPNGVCPEVEVHSQSDSDNGGEMTWRPNVPTDTINGTRTHGPSSCGTDAHGRRYMRTRAQVSAAPGNGAICELTGPYQGFLYPSVYDCRIRVHYQTVRMGSNVWCSGTWWGRAAGAYQY